VSFHHVVWRFGARNVQPGEQFVDHIVHDVKESPRPDGQQSLDEEGATMQSTYRTTSHDTRFGGSHPRVGLTDPAVIEAYVAQRIQDPSLLSRRSEVSYADFFVAPAA
jgi:hypothetical protein